MQDIRLIAVDLDGTLLNSDKRISSRNLTALRAAAQKGVYVAIATGRIYRSAMYISNSIAPKQPYLSSNGAVVGFSHRPDFLYHKLLRDEDAQTVIKYALSSHCQFHVHTLDGRMLHLQTPEKLLYYCGQLCTTGPDGVDIQIMPPEELIEQARGQIIKIVVQNEDLAALNAFRMQMSGSSLSMASSWWDNEEIMAPGADKGEGLRALAAQLHIPMEQVMALGDNQNDRSMFLAAGFPVAMGNATDEIRSISKAVTLDNDHSGVGCAVEKYVLHQTL